jgi:hypothetical protein
VSAFAASRIFARMGFTVPRGEEIPASFTRTASAALRQRDEVAMYRGELRSSRFSARTSQLVDSVEPTPTDPLTH